NDRVCSRSKRQAAALPSIGWQGRRTAWHYYFLSRSFSTRLSFICLLGPFHFRGGVFRYSLHGKNSIHLFFSNLVFIQHRCIRLAVITAVYHFTNIGFVRLLRGNQV